MINPLRVVLTWPAEVGTDDSRNCIWYVFLLVSNLTLMYSPLPEPPVYVVV